MVTQGRLYPLGVGGPDPLVDRQGLTQLHSAMAGLVILEVTSADAFQRARLLKRCGHAGGDREGLLMTGTRFSGGSGCQRQLTHVVENLRFADPVAQVAD